MNTAPHKICFSVLLSLVLPLAACSQQPVAEYIDVAQLSYDLDFENTRVGGLSGMDYDEETGLFYMLSDDRSKKAPARFYTVKMDVNGETIEDVVIQSKTTL